MIIPLRLTAGLKKMSGATLVQTLPWPPPTDFPCVSMFFFFCVERNESTEMVNTWINSLLLPVHVITRLVRALFDVRCH
jgi:hypothetical protein